MTIRFKRNVCENAWMVKIHDDISKQKQYFMFEDVHSCKRSSTSLIQVQFTQRSCKSARNCLWRCTVNFSCNFIALKCKIKLRWYRSIRYTIIKNYYFFISYINSFELNNIILVRLPNMSGKEKNLSRTNEKNLVNIVKTFFEIGGCIYNFTIMRNFLLPHTSLQKIMSVCWAHIFVCELSTRLHVFVIKFRDDTSKPSNRIWIEFDVFE